VIKNSKYLIFLWVVCYTTLGFSHGAIHHQIQEISTQIEHQPANSQLLLKRGRLHLDARHYQEALADFSAAQTLSPDTIELNYWLGVTYSALQDWPNAELFLSKFLKHAEISAKAHREYAYVLTPLNKKTLAVNHYHRAIEFSHKIDPQLVIERARLQSQLPDVSFSKIEHDVKQVMQKQGKLVTYIELLIDLSQQFDQFERTLYWIKQLPPKLVETPEWQVKQAELFAAVGKLNQSKTHYKKALDLIARLPKHRQQAKVYQDLKTSINKSLIK
jgi:tetratricopeptide (TPR) repeat protein